MRPRRWLLLALVGGSWFGTAAAQTAADLDIRIERDTRPRPAISELGVFHIVTITERATGEPPADQYDVYGLARNQQGEETESFNCSHARDDDPGVAAGVYLCPIFVDHGGRWDFVTVVNELGTAPDLPPVTVAEASAPFDLETDQVYTGGGEEGPKTSAGDVALLWLHVLAAAAWSLCAAVLAALAIPGLRARLSALGTNRLERRFDFLVKLSWAMTAGVTGSGTYLLVNETAYETPFSASEMDAVFALPYAKPYYISLMVKLALYGLMIVALAVLVRGARRQLRFGFEGVTATRPTASPWPVRQAGSVTTVESPPALIGEATADGRRASVLVAVAGAVIAVGLLGMSLCVTLLKYFHQLIEATLGQAGP